MSDLMVNDRPVPLLASPNHSPRPRDVRPSLIVLHSTGGSYAGALAWLRDPESHVSAHFLIGRDGTTVQLVPLTRAAWQAGRSSWRGQAENGSVNAFSIGIEMEHFDGKQEWPEAQLLALFALLKQVCEQYSIPADAVVGHADVARPIGRKVDPVDFPWGRLRMALYTGPVVLFDGERVPARLIQGVLYAPARRLLELCGKQGRWDPVASEFLVVE